MLKIHLVSANSNGGIIYGLVPHSPPSMQRNTTYDEYDMVSILMSTFYYANTLYDNFTNVIWINLADVSPHLSTLKLSHLVYLNFFLILPSAYQLLSMCQIQLLMILNKSHSSNNEANQMYLLLQGLF